MEGGAAGVLQANIVHAFVGGIVGNVIRILC